MLVALLAADWGGAAALEAAIACPARPALLAHYRGPGIAYAAFACGPALRSIAVIGLDGERTLRIGFTLSPQAAAPAAVPGEAFFRREWVSGGDTLALAASVSGGAPPEVTAAIGLDLAGVRTGDRVILFHTTPRSARSTLSADVEGKGPFRFLVGGLSAGTWEIWRGGWLEDHQAGVNPGTGALVFEGWGGSYFFGRIGR
jgi:hypothetical protein